MQKSKVNMLTGNLFKNVFMFCVPLALSNLLQVLFNTADVAVAGRFAGPEALGAVGSTTVVVVMFSMLVIGLGNGMNVHVARAIGGGRKQEIEETVHSAFLIGLLGGIALMAAGLVLTSPLLSLMHTKSELLEGASRYLYIYFCGMPAMGIYNFGNAVLSAQGNTKKALRILSFSGILNVLMNLFFVIVLQLDVVGVALASAIAQWISGGLIMAAVVRDKGMCRFQTGLVHLYPQKFFPMLKLCITCAIQNAIFEVANLFVQFGINSFDTVIVEGNAAASNLDGLVYEIMGSTYAACTSFMGQNYGAGNKKRMFQSFLVCQFYAIAAGLVLGLAACLFGEYFLGVFTTDADVVQAGMERLRIIGASYCLTALMDGGISASRGIGKTVVPTIVVILGSCVFRIAWIFTVFAYFQTTVSLYLVFTISWALIGFVEVGYFIHCFKKVKI